MSARDWDRLHGGFRPFDFSGGDGKERNIRDQIDYDLIRTRRMIEYRNLPSTIPEWMLSLMLQTDGYTVWFRGKNNQTGEEGIYALSPRFGGSLGGEPNVYYFPETVIIANPRLESRNLKLHEDAFLLRNDCRMKGVIPLLNKYDTAIAETELTLQLINVNTRMVTVLSAQDEETIQSAQDYLSGLEEGALGVIADGTFLEGIKAQNIAHPQGVYTEALEYLQYLKGSKYNELGLQSNFNMKRESLNDDELNVNEYALMPYVDDIIETQKEDIKEINEMLGLNVEIELGSSWKKEQMHVDLELKAEEAEVESETEHETDETEADADVNEEDNAEEVEDEVESETEHETDDAESLEVNVTINYNEESEVEDGAETDTETEEDSTDTE